MRSVAGLIFIVMGVLALFVRSVTYFTTERVSGPLGFFEWDVSQPHTVFLSPLAGIIAIGIGVALMMMGRRAPAT